MFTTFALIVTTLYLFFAFSSKYVGADIICSVMFMLLPLVIMLSTLGYEAVLQKVDDRYTNAVIVALAFFLTCLPLRHIIFNRPLTLCYFNEVSGGIHNAADRYSLDVNNQSSKVAEQWFTQFYTAQQDSLLALQKQQHDRLRAQLDSMGIYNQYDSLLYTIKIDTAEVYTNGNEAFCSSLADDNPTLRVYHAEVHSIEELEGDYYILFGNQTGLFKQIDSAFYTIDLERVPLVSFFKKDKNRNNMQQKNDFVVYE